MPSADRNRDVGFPSEGEDTKPCFQRGLYESFVSPPRKGRVAKRYTSGLFALSLAFVLISDQGRGMALCLFNYSQVVFISP
jgi:hypothetical protein